MRRDQLLDLGDETLPELGVPQRALQRRPRLRRSEGEPRGLEATAARTREDGADADAVSSECLADAPRLRPTGLIEVALGRAIIQPCVGRIEGARRVAVAHEHDSA